MEYQPLDQTKDEIRLLTILQSDVFAPDLGHFQPRLQPDNLHCELSHHPLKHCSSRGMDKSKLPFLALSYTWGNPRDRQTIYANGTRISVGKNLAKCLQALKELECVKIGYKIWADAICINQEDSTERSREVKKMAELYKSASNVAIWLGESDAESDETFDFINAITAAAKKGPEVVKQYLSTVLDNSHEFSLWKSMTSLLSRPYFGRLWIIQEMAAGGEDSLVLCGDKTTTWGALYNVYHDLRLCDTQTGDSELALIFRASLELYPAAYKAYRDVPFYIWKQVEDFQTLQNNQRGGISKHSRRLLSRCRMANCTNNWDRVYGILGLLEPHLALKIQVNYEASISDVYTSFTRTWIEHTGKLEILAECGESGEHYLRDDTIPSWAVDLKQTIKSLVSNYHQRYRASLNLSMSYQFNGTSLLVRGVVFGEIDGVSGVRYWEDEKDEPDFVNPQCYINPYGDDEAFTEALWYTLVGGRDAQGYPASDALACILDDTILDPDCALPFEYAKGDTDASLWWHMHLWWKRNAEFNINGRPLKRHLKHMDVRRRDSRCYFDALARMSRFFWSRRLIVTKTGHLGVASRPVRRGDLIVIIGGCSVPLTLRAKSSLGGECGPTFEILGECFIYGFMNGEISQSVNTGLHAMQDLTLI